MRMLTITFNTKIDPWEIPKFRGALAEKVGYQHTWFHNHKQSDTGEITGVIYRYPRIQYKMFGQFPMLVFIENGIEEAQHFFNQDSWNLKINNTEHLLEINRLDVRKYNLGVYDQTFRYTIYKWLALNQENHKKWGQLEGIVEKAAFLEDILVGNILGFAAGVDWKLDARLSVKITEIKQMKEIKFKGVSMLAFDVQFSCNAYLPEFVGVGKGASGGFGVIRKQVKHRK